MRRYETVFIVNPELSEEQRQPLFDKLKGLVSEDHGMLVKFDEWGHKGLAYEIKKNPRGYYVLMEFCGDVYGSVRENAVRAAVLREHQVAAERRRGVR